jgi:hypothetical protein
VDHHILGGQIRRSGTLAAVRHHRSKRLPALLLAVVLLAGAGAAWTSILLGQQLGGHLPGRPDPLQLGLDLRQLPGQVLRLPGQQRAPFSDPVQQRIHQPSPHIPLDDLPSPALN